MNLKALLTLSVTELEAKYIEAKASYDQGTPIMSDADFDALETRLRARSPNSTVLNTVGAPTSSGWSKVLHPITMGSLEKVQTISEFLHWTLGFKNWSVGEFALSEKLDGISILLTYEGGKFVRGCTRGDGTEGEDITRNVAIMKGVPPTIPDEGLIHVRGEIVCEKADFLAFFPGESNPRNTASGTAKRQSGWQKCRHLTVRAYNIFGSDATSRSEEFGLLTLWGFQVPFWEACEASRVAEIYSAYGETLRDSAPYDIDGLVIEVNDTSARESFGTTPDGFRPKGAVALKFPHDQKKTILRNIQWQVGPTGRVTPVAIFDEVVLAGATVTQASLHTPGRVQALQLFEGCEILVSRRNDVIPYVEKNVSLNITV